MIAPLIVSCGEPAGIGPDLVLDAATRDFGFSWLAIGNADLLESRAQQLKLNVSVVRVEEAGLVSDSALSARADNTVYVLNQPLAKPCIAGELNADNAGHVLAILKRAHKLCQRGMCSAMVTGPVQKSVIAAAGFNFSGHTEYLAELSGISRPVMMLTTQAPQPLLRVALVTTHLPLSAVPTAITNQSVSEAITILHNDLKRRFGVAQPLIRVCGLNPHAGENGYLGREEIDVITPVIQQLRVEGIKVEGPFPADTLFTPKHLRGADAVLAMYHDQGLSVLKYAGFGNAVNVTLGLDIIRTSVDHGTALDLAGSGQADSGSLVSAMNLAAKMARTNEQTE